MHLYILQLINAVKSQALYRQAVSQIPDSQCRGREGRGRGGGGCVGWWWSGVAGGGGGEDVNP